MNVNPSKLIDELRMLVDIECATCNKDTIWISFVEGTDMSLVQSIVDAHDSSPISNGPSEIDLIKQQVELQKNLIDAIVFDILPNLVTEEGI